MSSQSKNPLVSIGMPTYNRPQEIRQALKCVTSQSYSNLEIIVSDNCSPGNNIQAVVREFADKDPRVKYYRQETNKGAAFNFKFVLEKAAGEYFAWMADDDEWDTSFVEKCLLNIKDCSSVMCKLRVCYKKSGQVFDCNLPDFSPAYSKYRNYKESILNPVPSLIYGLHKRQDILWFLHFDMFDFSDCFFISKLIVQGNGISLIQDFFGFQTNIVGTDRYKYKPFEPADDRLFLYGPFIRHHRELIAGSSFSYFQKQFLFLIVLWRTAKWFTKYEKKYKPFTVMLVKSILRPVRNILKLKKIPLIWRNFFSLLL